MVTVVSNAERSSLGCYRMVAPLEQLFARIGRVIPSTHHLLPLSMKRFLASIFLMAATHGAYAEVISGKVIRVADGDTITVLDAQMQQHKVRLAGIDAPERRQAFGHRAQELLASLVASQQVDVETEKTDKYGRLVGKVLVHGRDINLAVVVAGLAWHYKTYESEQTPADRMLYASAELEARNQRKGLWIDPSPEAPWTWRSLKRGQSGAQPLP